MRFVIDSLLAGDLAARIDAEHIGLFGMSLGSLTVWGEVVGAAPDPRIDALVQSDGATLVDDIGAVPFPVFVAHSDVDPIFPYAGAVAAYDELPDPKYLLTLHGAGHATVGEDTVTSADVIYREATTALGSDAAWSGDGTVPRLARGCGDAPRGRPRAAAVDAADRLGGQGDGCTPRAPAIAVRRSSSSAGRIGSDATMREAPADANASTRSASASRSPRNRMPIWIVTSSRVRRRPSTNDSPARCVASRSRPCSSCAGVMFQPNQPSP